MTLVGRREHVEVHAQDERRVDWTKTFQVYASMTSHAAGLITVYHFQVKAHVHFTIACQ